MRGDSEILIREFAKDFCLERALIAAGYKGRGRIYTAARDIERRADLLRELLGDTCDTDAVRRRILAEYERIAFSDDADKIRVSDKLKALEMYRLLSSPRGDTEGDEESHPLVVNYDYGE